MPVLIWIAGAPVARMRSASFEGLLVAFDDGDGQLALELLDGLHEQRGLAGAGAGDKVQRQDARRVEARAVGGGVGVVLAENVLLDLHHAGLAGPAAVVMIVMPVLIAVVVMIVAVVMIVIVIVMAVGRRIAVALGGALVSMRTWPSPHPQTAHISRPPFVLFLARCRP